MTSAVEMIEGLQKFWDANGVVVKCPVCRGQDFNIDVGAEIYQPLAVNVETAEKSDLSIEIAAYALYCIKCGFVLNFMKSVPDKQTFSRPSEQVNG